MIVVDLALVTAVVAGALVAVGARELAGALRGYLLFGAALAASSLRLGAWDVAVAEVLLGTLATAWVLWWAAGQSSVRPLGSSRP